MISKWNRMYFSRVFCAYLCSIGVLMFLVDYLPFSHTLSMFTICVACAGVMLLLVLISSHVYAVVAVLAGLTLPLLYYYLFQTTALYAFFAKVELIARWTGPFYEDTTHTNPPYEFVLLCVMIATVSFLFFFFSCVCRSVLVMVLLTLSPGVILGIFSSKSLPVHWMIPAIFGILFYMSSTVKMDSDSSTPQSRTPKGYWQTVFGMIPTVLACLVLMSLMTNIVPPVRYKSQDVADYTNDILSFLNLPLQNSKGQRSFSLSQLGYYPDNTILGGTPTLTDDKIMIVTSEHSVLLRANMYENYETTSWGSNSSLFTCRLDSSLAKDRTQDVFDMNRPDKSEIPSDLYYSVMEKVTISITYLHQSLGITLFSADHLLDISKEDHNVYYNEDEEIFFAKNSKDNETYSMTYNRFRTESSGFATNLLALESYIIEHPEAGDSKKKLKTIADEFLPVIVPDSVREYALSITNADSTPLQKVLDIQKDLTTHFTYSLLVADLPESTDFVQNFLETKTGYCTYFASAMTVMARINGIPARYVEGFSSQVPTGTRFAIEHTVTGKNGHAWCEVYVDGIGWIPMDATPGYASSNEPNIIVTVESSPTITGFELNAGTPPPHGNPNDINAGLNNGGASDDIRTFFVWVRDTALLPLLLSEAVLICAYLFLTLRRWEQTFVLIPLSLLLSEGSPQDASEKFWDLTQRHLSLMSIRITPEESVADFAVRTKEILVKISGCGEAKYHFQCSQIAFLYEKWIFGSIPPTEEELTVAYKELADVILQVREAHTSHFHYVLHFLVWTK